ncbi:MAG: M13 family metallopeptidase [Psychroflexus halocasei]|uniref:M13 family metallopeptidase n=1 Tax=Psychroflexus sp. S27 TaxID=1982757 RepID=UPI000C2A23D5|nr:M13 family metallopeptidase [Psychroflexus sp. S27]PJX21636.1 endothelin-converting protein [Psychroflexus sp. S27]
MKIKQLTLSLASLAVLASCQDGEQKNEIAESAPGIDVKYMDQDVRPQDDFYTYVNGQWNATAEIPDDRTSWGGFQILRQKTDNDVLEILKKAESSGQYEAGTDQAKALNVFNSIMDTERRNEEGLKPIEASINKIEAIKNAKDLQELLAKNSSEISSPFFSLSAYSDPNDSNINIAYIGTGSLGLPERDYYLKDDEDSKKIRKQYVDFVTEMLQYLGDSEEDARDQANRILALETELAKDRLTKVERRDFRNYNNRFHVDNLDKAASSVDWKKYMTDLGVEKLPDTVLVMETKYMTTLDKMLKRGNVDDWKVLLRWSTLNDASGYLSEDIEKTSWNFYSKTLSGAQAQRPLDERALSVVNNTIGEAVGQLYVDAKFPPEAKQKAEAMIQNVILAFEKRIDNLEWMSEDSKAEAIKKLEKFTVKIGYPDEFKDYSDLKVNKDKSYYENMVAVGEWNYQDNLSKIGEPVDKTEWGMAPQIVNAYFNPMFNEIVFPAAILQPPFYDYKADAAVNYGGIGAVIGHEISHAFDDSGARFDAEGNLKNWWSEEDLKQFTERGKALADLYSSIEVLDSVYVDGDFTLGENIGDLGGVLGAYDGLQMHLKENGNPGKIEGLTPEQRFFVSWATVWRTKTRDEALKTQVKTDPHSPGKYRAYVPLQNVDAFYEAFDIKETDSLYIAPEERVRIW